MGPSCTAISKMVSVRHKDDIRAACHAELTQTARPDDFHPSDHHSLALPSNLDSRAETATNNDELNFKDS